DALPIFRPQGLDEHRARAVHGCGGHHAGDRPDVRPVLCLLPGPGLARATREGARMTADRIDLMIVIHSLRGGGAERVAVDLAAGWQARGCQVMIVTQTDASHDAYPLPEGVRRHALGLAADSAGALCAVWGNLMRCLALGRLVQRHRPTIVLGMMTRGSVLAVLAARGRSRVIATEHAHPPSLPLPAFWE